jgi:hypothetical protein
VGGRSLRQVVAWLGAIRRDERGSVFILFAFIVVVLIAGVAVAIDYTRAASDRTHLQVAADQAVIAVMRQMQLDGVSSGALPANDQKHYEDLAEEYFKNNVKAGGQSPLSPDPPFFKINFSDGNHKATAEFGTKVPLAFASIIGMSDVTVGGVSVAVRPADATVVADIHLLIDTSASMGLAASVADRNLLEQKTDEAAKLWMISDQDAKCTFACHSPRQNKSGSWATYSTLDIAKNNKVTLRIDVAKDAAAKVLDLADYDSKNNGSDFRFALHTFNDAWTLAYHLSNDYKKLKQEAAKFVMGYPNLLKKWDEANTKIDSAQNIPTFAKYLNNLPTADPSTQGRKQYVILVTDGVRSEVGETTASGLVRVFDQAECKRIKDTGATLAVIYTVYVPNPGNAIFQTHVDAILPYIEPNLKTCASSSSFFAKGDSPLEIETAFKDIFTAIKQDASKLRLTQ